MPRADSLSSVSIGLRDRVLERLGVSRLPPCDVGGLTTLYAAWCARVPFDNVRRMIAICGGRPGPLPGTHADDFFAHWLAHGTGGTCWPSSNALVELARAAGFDVRRRAGCMRDAGVVNHGTATALVGDGEWLIDSSMLTNAPLPLRGDVFVGHDAIFTAEVEPVGDTHVIWWSTPSSPTYLPCRLQLRPVDHGFYAAAYEASRASSPFNRRLIARRNRPGELLVVVGDTLFTRTAAGDSASPLAPGTLLEVLRDAVGLSGDVIDAWVEAGGLEATRNTPAASPSPDEPRRPPSQR